MLNIPYSESRQHRWLIYGRVEHSWKHRIYRGLHSPLRYQPPPTSLIRPSNIYGKVSRIIESFDLINSSFDWFWCVLFRETGSIIRSFSTGLEILSRSQRSRTSDSREEYSTENWIFVEVCCDNFYQQRRKNTGTINLRVDRGEGNAREISFHNDKLGMNVYEEEGRITQSFEQFIFKFIKR